MIIEISVIHRNSFKQKKTHTMGGIELNMTDLRLKQTVKILTIMLASICVSLICAACSKDNFSEKNDSNRADEQTDNRTKALASAKIQDMADCKSITTALGDFAADYQLDDFHFDDDGFSCFYIPPRQINSGYITIIGTYSTDIFETAEELEEHQIYDVFYDKRVNSFGGVAFGLNEHDGNDVVTQIKTPDFELSLNVTGERIDLMYGKPSIDILLKLIEIDES